MDRDQVPRKGLKNRPVISVSYANVWFEFNIFIKYYFLIIKKDEKKRLKKFYIWEMLHTYKSYVAIEAFTSTVFCIS